jgi:hypothetical protein
MVDWQRVLETRGWRRGTDARSLRTDLRRLPVPAEGVRLLLRPDQASGLRYASWKRKIELPPCRLVWIGDVVASPEGVGPPHVQALVVLLESGEVGTITLPLTVFRFATVARVLRELPLDEARAYGIYGGPGPEVRFSENRWQIDLWFDRAALAVVTAEEIPALGVETLAGHPQFASCSLCVVADRPARRLAVLPCWEIFRFYSAQSVPVAQLAFQFPRWGPETPDRLLERFDGHRFCAQGLAKGHRPGAGLVRHASKELSAVGRDALVTYARTGRAQIRAVPPFRGPARLMAIRIPLQLGEFAALFIQQIVESVPGEGDRGVIRWKKVP